MMEDEPDDLEPLHHGPPSLIIPLPHVFVAERLAEIALEEEYEEQLFENTCYEVANINFILEQEETAHKIAQVPEGTINFILEQEERAHKIAQVPEGTINFISEQEERAHKIAQVPEGTINFISEQEERAHKIAQVPEGTINFISEQEERAHKHEEVPKARKKSKMGKRSSCKKLSDITKSQAVPVAGKCPICGQDFKRLRVHLRLHTRERVYQCKECGQAFVQTEHLRRHENTHRGKERTLYPCDICGKNLTRKDKKKEHMLKCKAKSA